MSVVMLRVLRYTDKQFNIVVSGHMCLPRTGFFMFCSMLRESFCVLVYIKHNTSLLYAMFLCLCHENNMY